MPVPGLSPGILIRHRARARHRARKNRLSAHRFEHEDELSHNSRGTVPERALSPLWLSISYTLVYLQNER